MIREPLDPETSSRYLWLGVFAQRIVDQLGDRDSSDALRQSLHDSIEALRLIEASGPKVDRALPFQGYEQVRTLFDVIAPEGRAALRTKLADFRHTLEELLSKLDFPDECVTTKSAEVFRRIASEALRRSKLPPEGISRRALELCHKV